MTQARLVGEGSVRLLVRLRRLYEAQSVRALAAGALVGLAFPPFGFWPGLFGFALLLAQLDRTTGRRPRLDAFICAWTAGVSFFLVSTWWVGEAFLVDIEAHGWQAPFAVFFLAAGLALLWGAAGAVYRLIAPAHAGRAIVFAGVFAVFEWLRGNILTGFPWDLPGEMWPAGSPMSQTAAFIGVYGLSLATLFIGAAPAILRRRSGGPERIALGAAVVLALGLWGAGAARLHGAHSDPGAGVRLRIVQADIGQGEKWSPEALRSIILQYAELTARPAAHPADVVIWPEAAIPVAVDDLLADGSWSRSVIEHALAPGQVLAMGAVRVDATSSPPRYFNSFLALRRTPLGLDIQGLYDKRHLVPFGEYMPFDRLASRIGFKTLVHIGDGFTPGPPSIAMSLPALPPLQPLICYESLFPGSFARTGVRPQWIVNVSNDAWFGETSGPWQHLNLASYRAIEEGVPMVRSTPTGVSAVIDAYGRPVSTLGLGRAGVLDAALPRALKPTFYVRWRETPFWLLCALTGFFALPFRASRRTPSP